MKRIPMLAAISALGLLGACTTTREHPQPQLHSIEDHTEDVIVEARCLMENLRELENLRDLEFLIHTTVLATHATTNTPEEIMETHSQAERHQEREERILMAQINNATDTSVKKPCAPGSSSTNHLLRIPWETTHPIHKAVEADQALIQSLIKAKRELMRVNELVSNAIQKAIRSDANLHSILTGGMDQPPQKP